MLDPNTPEHSKKAIIALLLKLREADNSEASSELGYIFHVASQLGLSEQDVYEIDDHKQDYLLKPPAEEKERITILYYFLFFMKADGKIDKAEEMMIKDFGFRLGFRPALTDDLVSVLKHYLNEAVPPDKLLDKIKAYLN